MRVCNIPGCAEIYEGNEGRCPAHRREARGRRVTNRAYSTPAHRAFRTAVLTRDPICVACRQDFATVADHYPRTRLQLIDDGANPNDPSYGRGLCAPCHNRHTAATSLGGFRIE